MGKKNLGKIIGPPGADGITPHIGENENWYIGNQDTGVRAQVEDERGVANGIATLDENIKIPLSQLPDAILGQMLHAGSWNADTGSASLTTNAKALLDSAENQITLTNDTASITGYRANQGNYYITGTAGTFAGISFDAGDWLVAQDNGWGKIDNSDAVVSVNGKLGAVVLSAADVGLGNVTNESKTTMFTNPSFSGTPTILGKGEIATKTDIEDAVVQGGFVVCDNLISNETSVALSANQGRVLNEVKVNSSEINKIIVDLVYPIGSILTIEDANFNPNNSFADTTWIQLTDHVLYASGSSFTVGSTGGNNNAANISHTHTIGSHNHTSAAHTHGMNSHTHSSAAHTHTGPSHNHTISGSATGSASTNCFGRNESVVTSGVFTFDAPTTSVRSAAINTGSSDGRRLNITVNGSVFTISNSGTGATGSTTPGATGAASGNTASTTPGATGSTEPGCSTEGESATNRNMMKYRVVAMWKRTA
ncbi:MAG: hypothetical protein FWH03_08235 [Firmicutes bacterium]|nr:hypothetical protein [Bacillota bacterium]